jgi:pimeloyl-ACP methyl ester carboxylesterase
MTIAKPGYLRLHPDDRLNFTMNRMAGSIPVEELLKIGERISGLPDWISEMLSAAERAEQEGRLLAAADFYRGAEFYMAPGAEGKREAYDRFLSLHDSALPEVAALRTAVPYQGAQLPVIDLPARGAEQGVILAHSGFDGLAEEMYPTMVPLADAGYRIVLFEGPGQGAALRHGNLHMPHDWEQAVAAVLDHFDISTCTLIGLSLGGYLAPRAAAFEPRIERVVAWGAMYDFMGCFERGMGKETFALLNQLIDDGQRDFVNDALASAGAENLQASWAIAHGMHVCGGADAFEFFQWLQSMNLKDVSHLIEQDTLIIMGANDHLVPVEQLYQQAAALTGARSVTTRLATRSEQGAEHCQIGNPGLVTDEILRWLEGLRRRDDTLSEPPEHLVSDEPA